MPSAVKVPRLQTAQGLAATDAKTAGLQMLRDWGLTRGMGERGIYNDGVLPDTRLKAAPVANV